MPKARGVKPKGDGAGIHAKEARVEGNPSRRRNPPTRGADRCLTCLEKVTWVDEENHWTPMDYGTNRVHRCLERPQ